MKNRRRVLRRGAILALMAGVLGMQTLWGKEAFIVVEEGVSPRALEQVHKQLEGVLAVDGSLTKELKKIPKVRIERRGDRYRLQLGPLSGGEEVSKLAKRLRRIFPHVQLLQVPTEKAQAPLASYPPLELPQTQERSEESVKLWIALFALAIVGILALFISSRKIQKLAEEQKKIRARHKEMEEQFNEVFSNMGENIYKLGKEIVDVTSDVMEKVGEGDLGGKLKQMINKETKILDTTSSLLEFLRIKAGKVRFDSEPFNFNRVLDEVVGNLGTRIRSSEDVELMFYIDQEFPRDVEGDFTHVVDSLTHLLEHAVVQSGAGEVLLHAKLGKSSQGSHRLEFSIDYRTPLIRKESSKDYFRPIYDEERGEYFRLECFIAKELVEIMEGEIRVETKENHVRVALVIPIELDEKEQRRYHLRSLELTNKSVLIVNRNLQASQAIAELFSHFRQHPDVMELSEYERRRPPLVKYDIVVVEESLVDPMLIEYTRKIRLHRDLKLVSVRNIFAPAEPHFDESKVDARLVKPLTMERVYQLIEELYPPQTQEKPKTEEQKKVNLGKKTKKKPSREFIRDLPATAGVDLGSFAEFGGASLLIVEDNKINRRMLLKVLDRSGMKLSSAVHGEEALEKVRNGEKFDLILMDINMPVMDGYTATQKIRKLPTGERLPIIALSALRVENELERMIQSGLDGYIPKPLNIGQLYTIFERYLRRNKERGRVAAQKSKQKIRYPEAIDMHKALEHTGENELLLQEMLKEFLELYGESDEKFVAMYEKRDLEGMRQELVDLLGLSGTIGAKDLYAAVKELYKALLLNDLEKFPSCIAVYSEALKSLKSSLRAYLNSLEA